MAGESDGGTRDRVQVVFVDDERSVLQGLRRALFSKRSQWDMRFFDSAREALEALATQPADVVVSDMRMPGMDGAAFLREVRDRYPASIRFMLSGYSEQELALRAMGPSHRFLSKPCDAASLSAEVERAMHLRESIYSSSMHRFVNALGGTPSLPRNVLGLIERLEDDVSSLEDIASLITADLGLTAQTLRVVNSGYFALRTPVTSVEEAVKLLGFDSIRTIATVSGVFSTFDFEPALQPRVQRLGVRCFRIGQLGAALARAAGLDAETMRNARLAGTLSHVGTLLLLSASLEEFRQVEAGVEEEQLDITCSEQRVFGFSHARLGAYLLGLWGFSDAVVEAVAFHHAPGSSGASSAGTVSCLHLAQALHPPERLCSDTFTVDDLEVDRDWLRRIGALDVLPSQVEAARELARQWLQQ